MMFAQQKMQHAAITLTSLKKEFPRLRDLTPAVRGGITQHSGLEQLPNPLRLFMCNIFFFVQYPEMSRYLLPIDDGDEVQHLGRTLECQLCGLRGKRCHLTLHFKVRSHCEMSLPHFCIFERIKGNNKITLIHQ